jgi:hypothetical protein
MAGKKKGSKVWDLEPDPVWVRDGNALIPSPFFLKWWETVAERRFGDRKRWLDAGIELGYISKSFDKVGRKHYYEAVGFDYNPALARCSLGLGADMPLVFKSDQESEEYCRLWKLLLRGGLDKTDGGSNSSHLGRSQ